MAIVKMAEEVDDGCRLQLQLHDMKKMIEQLQTQIQVLAKNNDRREFLGKMTAEAMLIVHRGSASKNALIKAVYRISQEEDRVCPVCLDPIALKNATLPPECLHLLHDECWMNVKGMECPVCRE